MCPATLGKHPCPSYLAFLTANWSVLDWNWEAWPIDSSLMNSSELAFEQMFAQINTRMGFHDLWTLHSLHLIFIDILPVHWLVLCHLLQIKKWSSPYLWLGTSLLCFLNLVQCLACGSNITWLWLRIYPRKLIILSGFKPRCTHRFALYVVWSTSII